VGGIDWALAKLGIITATANTIAATDRAERLSLIVSLLSLACRFAIPGIEEVVSVYYARRLSHLLARRPRPGGDLARAPPSLFNEGKPMPISTNVSIHWLHSSHFRSCRSKSLFPDTLWAS